MGPPARHRPDPLQLLSAVRRRVALARSLIRNARADQVVEGRPLVSVVLATYNWSSVLRYSIRSALWQTYPNLELLVDRRRLHRRLRGGRRLLPRSPRQVAQPREPTRGARRSRTTRAWSWRRGSTWPIRDTTTSGTRSTWPPCSPTSSAQSADLRLRARRGPWPARKSGFGLSHRAGRRVHPCRPAPGFPPPRSSTKPPWPAGSAGGGPGRRAGSAPDMDFLGQSPGRRPPG